MTDNVEPHGKPTLPFRPRAFIVAGPTRLTTQTRPRGPIYGKPKVGPNGEAVLDGRGRVVREIVGWKQEGKSRVCWDLRIEADGHRWYDRHYAAGQAQAARDRLEAGFRAGWRFDPDSKRFLPPDESAGTEPTVFSEAVSWWRAHWSTIEPRSRRETLRYISRPIAELVRPDTGDPPAGIGAYLQWQLLPPKTPDAAVPAEHLEAAEWMRAASAPIRDVDAVVWQAYVDRWRINSRTGKLVAQSSLTRHLADVRQFWAWVCAVHQLPNGWQTVKTGARSSAGGRRGTTVKPVDRTIVLSPNHVRELARVCGEGPFGPLAEVYVLLLGIAGGRPAESAGVHIADLDVGSGSSNEVRFKRTSRRGIDQRFLDTDDDPEWGPLKGREIEDERSVPLPSRDAQRIYELLQAAGVATGLLFDGWDWDKFDRDVWSSAKMAMAAIHADHRPETKGGQREAEALCVALARLRLHDLRHAACSMWLNTPGLEVRVACEWSGHKRLSVFLDIYQGLMPGSLASGKEKLDATWGG